MRFRAPGNRTPLVIVFDMKKILFLGYNSDQTSLIDKIKFHKKNWSIKQTQKKIDLNTAKNLILLLVLVINI